MLTPSDFTGPWTHPRTGREYASFGAWFDGEAPIDFGYGTISPEAVKRWADALAFECEKQSFFQRLFKHAEGK